MLETSPLRRLSGGFMGVLYKEVKHIIDQQYEAESRFLEEYKKESHTIANPFVVLNISDCASYRARHV